MRKLFTPICLAMLSCSMYCQASDKTDQQVVSLLDGTKVAIWQDNDNGSYSIMAATYNPLTEVWSQPVIRTGAQENSFCPKVYADNFGNIALFFIAVDSTNGTNVLKCVTKLSAGSWGVPVTLSLTSENVLTFDACIQNATASSSVSVTWNSISLTNGSSSIWIATAQFGQNWSSAVKLS